MSVTINRIIELMAFIIKTIATEWRKQNTLGGRPLMMNILKLTFP